MGTGFWLLALLWLPVLVIGAIVLKYLPYLDYVPSPDKLRITISALTLVPMGEVQVWVRLLPLMAMALVVFASVGLLIALLCRELWRLGYRRSAWAIAAVAAATTAAQLPLGMDLFLPGFALRFQGIVGPYLAQLYYAGQMLPTWIVLYVAALNLILWGGVLFLQHRRQMAKPGRFRTGEHGAPPA